MVCWPHLYGAQSKTPLVTPNYHLIHLILDSLFCNLSKLNNNLTVGEADQNDHESFWNALASQHIFSMKNRAKLKFGTDNEQTKACNVLAIIRLLSSVDWGTFCMCVCVCVRYSCSWAQWFPFQLCGHGHMVWMSSSNATSAHTHANIFMFSILRNAQMQTHHTSLAAKLQTETPFKTCWHTHTHTHAEGYHVLYKLWSLPFEAKWLLQNACEINYH